MLRGFRLIVWSIINVGKNEKGNTRLAEANRAEKKGVASAFPPLPSVALKEERKKDDKRLTKNWSTIVVVNSDNSAGKQKPSTSVKRSNPEKLQPKREGSEAAIPWCEGKERESGEKTTSKGTELNNYC